MTAALRMTVAAVALCACFYAWGAAVASAATYTDPTNNVDLNARYAAASPDTWTPADFAGETTVAAIASFNFYPSATPAQTVADAAWEFASTETATSLGVGATTSGELIADAVDTWATTPADTWDYAGEYVNPNGVRVVFMALASGYALNQDTAAVVATSASPWAAVSPPPPPSITTVSLSAEDQTRLDYMWWGAWAVVGLLLLGLVSTSWSRAMKLDRV